MKPSFRVLAPLGVLLAGVVGAAALVALGPEVTKEERPPDVPLVRFVTAQPTRFEHRVVTHGTVQPRAESELVPEVSGRIEWLAPSFASGGFFQQGDPLVRIEAGDYDTAVKRAEAAVARARSERSRARKDLERQERLAQKSVASESRFDDARNAAAVAAAALSEALAEREQARRDLARTQITATFDGRVRSESADVGQFVSRGAAIATIYAVDFAEVRLPVPDAEIAYLDLPQLYQTDAADESGPAVTLHAEFAGKRHAWEGRVVRTEGEIDPRTRMVVVVARVDSPYERNDNGRPPLATGLFVEAEIAGRTEAEVYVLPRSALRDGSRVLVIDAEDRLRWREVEVVRTDRQHAILGSGLSAGERVCTSTLESPVEGMRVRVRSAVGEAG